MRLPSLGDDLCWWIKWSYLQFACGVAGRACGKSGSDVTDAQLDLLIAAA